MSKMEEANEKNDYLSDFLLHASEEEKQRVFVEAANRANKDQQDLVKLSKKPKAALGGTNGADSIWNLCSYLAKISQDNTTFY